jgi:hypothetical protein
MKNREISNVKSTNFLGVVIGGTLSWNVHNERTCSRISCNLFIINRLSRILDLHGRRTLYYGLIYPLLAYGILWGQSAKGLVRRIYILQKSAVIFLFELWGMESILGPLGTVATPGLLYLPRVIVRMEKSVE